METNHTIKLNHIAKIEGHAKLNIRIENGRVEKAKIETFEGARFFEDIIKNRKYGDAPVLTSRICGTCSPSHLVTSLKAVEDAFNVKVSEQTKLLRELLVLGSYLQNHTLHLYFLSLPDYLGFDSAIEMASKHPKEVERALKIKKIGNEIVSIIGGREVHPITPIIGGFSKLPPKNEVNALLRMLESIKQDAVESVKLFSNLKYPSFERETKYFALKSDTYSLVDGAISCTGNMCIPTKDYQNHFKEYFEEGSKSEFVVAEGNSYMVGALARLNNNFEKLPKDIQDLVPFRAPSFSPFSNNVAQAIELVFCVERAVEILQNLELEDEGCAEIKVKAGRGVGITEAPRGMLFHDYTFDGNGFVAKANITTPTSQNLRNMEDDIKAFLPGILNLKESEIVLQLEKLIRAYDPCISCSTHFLKVNWEK
ncbi:MAG: Ni/Fe hydrogenase subunit alpha [Candidatus Woesearchaeota archaeon]|nr:Ni/Fe hydrogenase subunit alpha [Candidatus Woesearchaeota archaeon]